MKMSNASRQLRNRKKDHDRHTTSTIQGCQPPDCTVKAIQSSSNRNQTTVPTTNAMIYYARSIVSLIGQLNDLLVLNKTKKNARDISSVPKKIFNPLQSS